MDRLLDPDLLRTFLAFAESGTLARAAAAVGRSPSAVTAQIQRLEADLGSALLAPEGRGRTLTEAGEALLPHARRVLATLREARLGMAGLGAGGRIGLGVTQDFADTALPVLLATFARSHPRVRLDLRIGRSVELAAELAAARIDLALAVRGADTAGERAVLREPMLWLAARPGLAVPVEPEVPLAMLDPPCGFREAAIAALGRAGRPHRIAATSPSLAGIRAALRAGLAVTARTARFMDAGIGPAPRALGLPPLPEVAFNLRLRAEAPRAATALAALLEGGLAPG